MMKHLIVALFALCLASPAFSQGATVGQGATPYHLVAANSTNSTLISAGQHTVYSVELGGVGSVPAFLKIYDKATAPTCGTDTPVKVLIIPAAATAANGAGSNVPFPVGINILNGLGICITGVVTDADTTAVAATTFVINIDYK